MIAPIVWLLPMCTQLRKCAVGDTGPNLQRLKMHGSELKFFVSIIYKIEESGNFENCEIFSNLYFSCAWDYKATLSGDKNTRSWLLFANLNLLIDFLAETIKQSQLL